MVVAQQLQYWLMAVLSWLFANQLEVALRIGGHCIALVRLLLVAQILVTTLAWLPLWLQRLSVILYILLCIVTLMLRELPQ